MTITVGGTAITFNDGTTQTTAAGGAPAFGAVGSVTMAAYNGTAYVLPGNTIAGSALYYPNTVSASPVYSNGISYYSGGSAGSSPSTTIGFSGQSQPTISRYDNGNVGFQLPQGCTALTGTWRALCFVPSRFTYYNSCGPYTTNNFALVLVQRIS